MVGPCDRQTRHLQATYGAEPQLVSGSEWSDDETTWSLSTDFVLFDIIGSETSHFSLFYEEDIRLTPFHLSSSFDKASHPSIILRNLRQRFASFTQPFKLREYLLLFFDTLLLYSLHLSTPSIYSSTSSIHLRYFFDVLRPFDSTFDAYRQFPTNTIDPRYRLTWTHTSLSS
jgi:hypothetical protein